MKNGTAIRVSKHDGRATGLYPGGVEADDWQTVKSVLSKYPMIEPRLRKLEKIAGGTPVHIWLAAALFEFIEWNDDGNRQSTLIHLICNHAGQDCEKHI